MTAREALGKREALSGEFEAAGADRPSGTTLELPTVFLLGAGASYGSTSTDRRPPLAKTLYAELCQYAPIFGEHTAGYEGIISKDFEEGMVAFIEGKGGSAGPFISKILAAYLLTFSPDADSVYNRLFRLLAIHSETLNPLVVTLNYDMMIERSLSQLGYGVTYGAKPITGNSFRLLKIHGSCNLLPTLRNIMQFHSNYWADWDFGEITDMEFHYNINEVYQFLHGDYGQFAPGICYMAPGKPILFGGDIIREHYEVFHSQLTIASQIVVAGTSVRDESDPHIWNALADAPGLLGYFDPFEESLNSFENWRVNHRVGPAETVQADFKATVSILERELRDATTPP